ncbi:hypothetical protein ABZ896_30515 [Streptomyces sp. NPDC047072]|uniref:hypothetical protein n=1 Tax=Streptomyces sp. NPDC047072 TaxID=3154809 RepID=UPI0034077E1D
MMLAALAITPFTQVPLLLASLGLVWQFAIVAALFLHLACAGAAGTTQCAIRQVVTADDMQARMQAVGTWLTSGGRPAAALLAGGLGTWIGVRPTLVPGSPAVASPSAEAVTPPTPSGPIVPNPAVAVDVRHHRSSEGGP